MLSAKEIKTFIRLLSKIKAHLPEEIFNALNKILPFAACEMVVTGPKKSLLLTFRQDEFWHGWHFPGSVIRNGEQFKDVLFRVAKDELGCRLKSFKFLLAKNYPTGARGHAVSLVFLCQLKGGPKSGKFFKAMPKSIIPEHKSLWRELKRKTAMSGHRRLAGF